MADFFPLVIYNTIIIVIHFLVIYVLLNRWGLIRKSAEPPWDDMGAHGVPWMPRWSPLDFHAWSRGVPWSSMRSANNVTQILLVSLQLSLSFQPQSIWAKPGSNQPGALEGMRILFLI